MSDSTILIISTTEAIANLPIPANLSHVKTLHIGARLYRIMPRDQLFAWISALPALRSIQLADDWIGDDQKAIIMAEFSTVFPGVGFEWSYDSLAGGKHGR